MRLSGKRALITGGNSGIGLATARLFIREGAKVAITGRNQETLDAAVAELGPNLLALKADVADFAATAAAVKQAADAFGGLDIVFANAGIGGSTPLGQTSVETFESILSTNLTGVFFTVQAAEPFLGKGGAVVLNGSVLAVLGAPNWSAYAASKAGVRAMSRVLASELAPRGIRVNVVVPGAARTAIWSPMAPTQEAREALDAGLARSIALGRVGEAEEVANTVLFLASDDASNITAAEIVVDGGTTGAPFGAPIYRG